MTKSTKQNEPSGASEMLVDRYKFYFETPLYEVIETSSLAEKLFEGDVDAFSAKNKFDTTYSVHTSKLWHYEGDEFESYYKVFLKCKRRGDDDVLRFVVLVSKKQIVKVGQHPTLADLHLTNLDKKYGKILDKENLQEFKKAVGLAANGVGAGSLIYLRRVFERQIWDVYSKKQEEIGLSEDEFQAKPMNVKVELLEKFLPEELKRLSYAYSILSKGIHSLPENDCRKYFPVIKLSIELILDEQIQIKKEAERKDKVRKALAGISQEIGNS